MMSVEDYLNSCSGLRGLEYLIKSTFYFTAKHAVSVCPSKAFYIYIIYITS
jgi:hypothetical protein